MSRPDPLYPGEALMLVAAAAPLALAEEKWWYLLATIAAVAAGWWTTARRRRPLIGPVASQALVVVATGLLIVEWTWVSSTHSVLALSHFMILVCISKLLGPRTYRDHAQLIILSLLLLVVASIVSGNLLFPMVLAVFMTIGLQAIIRYQLDLETFRAERHNRGLMALPETVIRHTSQQGMATGPYPGRALTRATCLGAVAALGVGSAIFVVCPRFGAGMLGKLEASAAGRAVTGFADHMNLGRAGPIYESRRPVMRVQVSYEGGTPFASGAPLYFRGTVLDQYQRSGPSMGYAWRRLPRKESEYREHHLDPMPDGTMGARLLDASGATHPGETLVQRYYLEPQTDRCLLTCYPATRVSSRDFDLVRRCLADNVLQVDRESGKVLRYEVHSPVLVWPSLAKVLADERHDGEGPKVLPPDPPLDRQAEILAMIDQATRGVGPLDEPAGRLAFLQRLEGFLRARPFSYTLNPPPVPLGAEPISHFLLKTKRGHCEYFASALAIMCQLKGIPARVVNGYCTGEYNSVGDFYLVRGEHAHAWVEAFVPGRDWITLDPTPSGGERRAAAGLWLPGVRRYLGYLQFQWSNLILAYDSQLRAEMFERFAAWVRRPMQDQRTMPGAVVAFVRELFGWRLDLEWHERAVYWVFSLLVVTLVVLSGYVVVVVTWRLGALLGRVYPTHTTTSSRAREVDFYHQFCRRLHSLGLYRRPEQTPAEFADELAARTVLLAEAPDLVRAYYEVIFGRRPLAPERRGRIQAFLKRLRALDQTQRKQLAAINTEAN